MEEKLRQLYYDPKEGLLGQEKLWRKANDAGIPVTQKVVKAFLDKQEVAQIHKRIKRPQKQLPFRSPQRNYILQTDLMFMDKDHKQLNHGCYIILCVVDIFSRYAWCVALKNKTAETVLAALEPILKEAQPHEVQFDGGSEFNNAQLKAFCRENKIEMKFHEPGDHQANGIVERFNQTLRRQLERYMTANDTKSWEPALRDIVHNYNHTYHSGVRG